MEHKYTSDSHTHSSCSPDGQHTPAAMAARAREVGLYAYTLTDHCECNEYDENYRKRSMAAWEAMESLKAPEGLMFLRGIELGQATQNLRGAGEAAGRYPYDLVIGSLHNVRNRKDFYYLDCKSMTEDEVAGLLDEYWEELLEMIEWGGFDTLGHLTYPLRYIQGEQGVRVDLERHMPKIDGIFRALIKNHKALEVNTSGLYGALHETMPGKELLGRYYELGGRLITFGSDAHCTENLSRGIDEAMEMARDVGFREFALYRQREPLMMPLE